MAAAMRLLLLALAVWFAAAVATIVAWNAAKSAVARRRSRISLAELIAELEAVA